MVYPDPSFVTGCVALMYRSLMQVEIAQAWLWVRDVTEASPTHWTASQFLGFYLPTTVDRVMVCWKSSSPTSFRSTISFQITCGRGAFHEGIFNESSYIDEKWLVFLDGVLIGTLRICWLCEWMSGKWGSAETQPFVLALEIFLVWDLLRNQVNMALVPLVTWQLKGYMCL